jgi:hypothetical protein
MAGRVPAIHVLRTRVNALFYSAASLACFRFFGFPAFSSTGFKNFPV